MPTLRIGLWFGQRILQDLSGNIGEVFIPGYSGGRTIGFSMSGKCLVSFTSMNRNKHNRYNWQVIAFATMKNYDTYIKASYSVPYLSHYPS